jgi:hypothetical protein
MSKKRVMTSNCTFDTTARFSRILLCSRSPYSPTTFELWRLWSHAAVAAVDPDYRLTHHLLAVALLCLPNAGRLLYTEVLALPNKLQT